MKKKKTNKKTVNFVYDYVKNIIIGATGGLIVYGATEFGKININIFVKIGLIALFTVFFSLLGLLVSLLHYYLNK